MAGLIWFDLLDWWFDYLIVCLMDWIWSNVIRLIDWLIGFDWMVDWLAGWLESIVWIQSHFRKTFFLFQFQQASPPMKRHRLYNAECAARPPKAATPRYHPHQYILYILMGGRGRFRIPVHVLLSPRYGMAFRNHFRMCSVLNGLVISAMNSWTTALRNGIP